ncbi:cysteine desulfurase family protein [Salinibacillus xinjiangensis]|uniref:Aminotransferase class V-fold PLP-dependent enzyme n=1 Tax=Salinibacillus xinjiangensis TaxID=1229268 RepID=A0A6G1X9Q6_9BACI|nr:cysteine desulfurase family protein [Salinibacillus xinjiangensis]MRG87714.1 aminotransferase class V-fold PLP-dependent enzyme [Salinibacillus xinjiangensis]
MIYLDNSATTSPYPEVLESFRKVSESYYGNPSSIHQFGGEAEKLLHKATKQAANLLKVDSSELIFTSGGTESNNLAIKGIALQHQNRGRHIITTQIEHPSVLEACQALESHGFDVTYLSVDAEGKIDMEQLKNEIRDDTILISVMHVNNELGTIQPIKQIADIVIKHPKLFFHVDHVQGLGKISLDFTHPGIHLCSMSSHKIHGLKGTGLLYIQSGTTLSPLLHGGGQQSSTRPGTENLAGIVAMVKAMRLTFEKQKHGYGHLIKLSDIIRNLLQKDDRIMINTPRDGAPHILNISVPKFKPEVVIHALGKKNIFISTKSACSSKHSDESAVLAACGLGMERTHYGLRISLSYQNTEEEVRQFCKEFKEVLDELNEVMR